MSIEEIRLSGILEEYALGLLSEADAQKAEGYLMQFPELQKDFEEIQKSLQYYAQAKAIKAPDHIEHAIIESLSEKKKGTTSSDKLDNRAGSNLWSIGSLLFGLLFLASIWFWRKEINRSKVIEERFNKYIESCDSINTFYQSKLQQYQNLGSATNRALTMTPTPNYQQTALIFHTNITGQENYIQILNLPEINIDQAFQLWSLKEGQDPIPLDVFKGDADLLIPVSFEEGTNTYAITIEPVGGSQSPNLSQLISTVNI